MGKLQKTSYKLIIFSLFRCILKNYTLYPKPNIKKKDKKQKNKIALVYNYTLFTLDLTQLENPTFKVAKYFISESRDHMVT